MSAAQALLNGEDFLRGRNAGDWLGSGTYFFQDAPRRALYYARVKAKIAADDPAILVARISLARSLDLVEQEAFEVLSRYVPEFNDLGIDCSQPPLTIDGGRAKKPPAGTNLEDMNDWDHAFLDYVVANSKQETGEEIDVIRAPFLWGHAVDDHRSFLFSLAHVQLCVRTRAAIIDDCLELVPLPK